MSRVVSLARASSLARPSRAMSTRLGRGTTVAHRARASASASDADAFVERLAAHQRDAATLSLADESRVIVDGSSVGTLSTIGNADAGALAGFPCGGVVAYASDAVDGLPIFALSSLSRHARDVAADGRATLTVTRDGFEDVGDGRVSLSGSVVAVEPSTVRETYLKKHPGAYWVDFGDFTWYKMTELLACRIVGGFARAGSVSASEYAATKSDPVAAFSAPVCSHMNADHGDALRAMAKHYAGVDADEVVMRSIDALGMNCRMIKDGEKYGLRLPFETPAVGRKEVKEQIVLMTKAAAAAASESS